LKTFKPQNSRIFNIPIFELSLYFRISKFEKNHNNYICDSNFTGNFSNLKFFDSYFGHRAKGSSARMSRNKNFTPFSYGSSSNNKPQQKSMNYGAVPPPAALTTTSRPTGIKAKSNYTSMDAISQYVIPTQSYGSRKRSQHTDDDYFDDDEAPEENLEYIPAAGSPANKQQSDSDEEDPLDAFMAGLEKAESKAKEIKAKQPAASTSSQSQNKGVRADIDDMDDEESYYQYMEDNPMAGVADENSGDELEYDEDGNPIAPAKKRFIDPLPPIDHSEIEYKTFEKNFYVIHEEIAKLTKVQKDELRHKLGIKVTGAAAPAPVCSFAHFNFDDLLIKAIRKSEYVSVSKNFKIFDDFFLIDFLSANTDSSPSHSNSAERSRSDWNS
jgi:hypothetical protein